MYLELFKTSEIVNDFQLFGSTHVQQPPCSLRRPKLCGSCAFPQNFHSRKLGEITVFCEVQVCWVAAASCIQNAIMNSSVIRQKDESLCVSGGKKCSFFGKFGVLCFLETPVL